MAKLRVGIIGTDGIADAHSGGHKGNLDKSELAAMCERTRPKPASNGTAPQRG